MTANKKVILLTSILCGISLIITYLISLNIAYKLFDLKWLSNTFLITIIGGIFASSGVVLLCEIQKYFLTKRELENSLWMNTVLSYAELLVVKHKIENILEDKSQPIPNGLFDESIKEIIMRLWSCCNADYNPIKKKKGLFPTFTNFKQHDCQLISKHLSEFQINFELNINNCKIEKLKAQNLSIVITSQNSVIEKFLKESLYEIDNDLEKIKKIVAAIDYSGRFDYEKIIDVVKVAYKNLQDFKFE